MSIDIENVTVISAEEFDSNNLYKDGYPLSASYLNKPLSTLKKELNHINFIVSQLINKDGVELYKKAMKVILKKIRAGTATDADIDNLYIGV